MSDIEALRAVLAALPDAPRPEGAVRLGGLTNRVYRVGDLCVRLPGAGTEEYIDRGNEAAAARAEEKKPRKPGEDA